MELDSVDLSDVLELKAVLDAGVFSSLLTVSVQPSRKGSTSIFVFQCDDVRVSTHTRTCTHTHTHSCWDSITHTLMSFSTCCFPG